MHNLWKEDKQKLIDSISNKVSMGQFRRYLMEAEGIHVDPENIVGQTKEAYVGNAVEKALDEGWILSLITKLLQQFEDNIENRPFLDIWERIGEILEQQNVTTLADSFDVVPASLLRDDNPIQISPHQSLTDDLIRSWIRTQRNPENLTPEQYQSAISGFEHADLEAEISFQDWFAQQVWPESLEAAVLEADLHDVYVAAWVVGATGDGTWVADNRWRNILNSFDAGGNISSSEVVDTRTSEGRIVENIFDPEAFLNVDQPLPIKTPPVGSERTDLQAYLQEAGTKKEIRVLQPESYSYRQGEERAKAHFKQIMEGLAKDAAREDAVSQSGGTKIYLSTERILVKDISFSNVQVKTWLYPLKVGIYTFENKRYRIILDGLDGGATFIENPSGLLKAEPQTKHAKLIEGDQKRLQRLAWVAGGLVVLWLVVLLFWE